MYRRFMSVCSQSSSFAINSFDCGAPTRCDRRRKSQVRCLLLRAPDDGGNHAALALGQLLVLLLLLALAEQ